MRLILLHQHDPTIPHVAGIGTFINTFIRNAPDDLEIDLVGVTDRAESFPPGRWHELAVGPKACRFFPLLRWNPIDLPRFPLTAKMLVAARRHRHAIDFDHALIETHRIEPVLGLLANRNPKVLFLHGNHRKDYYNPHTEVKWGRLPSLYFWLEDRLVPRFDHVYVVREDAVDDYRAAFPKIAERFSFLPTWVDDEIFTCLPTADRREAKRTLCGPLGIDERPVFLFVGRFEGQKNPALLLESFARVKANGCDAVLVTIGDGSLKQGIQERALASGLANDVYFLPPCFQSELAQWMNVADILCLSSAFEGMPRVVVEALHCGLPVVSTAVGEAVRLIGDGQGGRLVEQATPEAFAAGMLETLEAPPSRASCRAQVAEFTARRLLEPVYARYRELWAARR